MTKQIVLFLALLLLITACNGDDKAEGDAVDTKVLIEKAAQQLDDAKSFQLTLAVSGAPVNLNAANIGLDIPIVFQRAEGVFVAPDGMQANVTVLLDAISAEINLIAVGNDQYLRHAVITLGNWRAEQFSPGFNPATLTKGEQSIPAALRNMQHVEYVGEEDLDGVSVHHLRGEVEAASVNAVTVGLIGTTEGMVKADVYIRTGNGVLEQLKLEEPINPDIDPDQPSIWEIGLYDYNGDYAVTRPEVQE